MFYLIEYKDDDNFRNQLITETDNYKDTIYQIGLNGVVGVEWYVRHNISFTCRI